MYRLNPCRTGVSGQRGLSGPVTVAWKQTLGTTGWGVPLETPHGIVFATQSGLLSFAIQSGKRQWHAQVGDVVRPPLLHGDVLYAGTRFPGAVVCVDARSGRLLWRTDTEDDFEPSPLVWNGKLLAFSSAAVLHVMDPLTGSILSGRKVGDRACGSLALSEDRLVLMTREGVVTALTEAAGQITELWRTQPAICDATATPALDETRAYVGMDNGRVYALDLQTGQVSWSFETQGNVRSDPAVDEGLVYFGSWDGRFYAVHAATGREAWRFEPTGERNPIQSGPVVAGRRVYCAVDRTGIFVLDKRSGEPLWHSAETDRIAGPWVGDGRLAYARIFKNEAVMLTGPAVDA
jgi:outer membrane protein assembly factor BamB